MSRFVVLLAAMTLLSARGFGNGITFDTVLASVASTTSCPNPCYTESFQIYNDGSLPGAAPVQFFDLYFDPTIYLESSLAVVPNAVDTDWGARILYSVGSTPDAFDALWNANGNYPNGTSPGIPAYSLGPTDSNGGLGSFEIQFSYLGQGSPGAQPFAISDPATEIVIQTGQTTSSVPEPATAFYLCSALLASIAWAGRRKFAR